MPRHAMEQIGRYEIVRELGRGGMGVVYLGRDPVIDRQVAIKTIQADPALGEAAAQQLEERFVREARAAGRLSHPGIVTVHDAGRDTASGVAFIAMEYVQGRNLDELLEERRTLPLADSLQLARQLAEALAYAHRQGVVHRDVKPANVLLSDDGQAKLTDFGIARLEDSQLTRTGQLIGSPQAMAPEQVAGGEVDSRADIFGLGVVLYQCLTGERPFLGDSLTTLVYQVLHVDPAPPSVANPALPRSLDGVLARMLAKAPQDRYPDAATLLEDLGALEAGSPPPHAATVVAGGGTVVSGRGAATLLGGAPGAATQVGPARPPTRPWWRSPTTALAAAALIVVVGLALLLASRAGDDPAAAETRAGSQSASPAGDPGPQDADAERGAVPAAGHASGTAAGTPRPTPAPTPDASGTATLIVDFEHHMESGRYSVSMDGREIHSGRLKARKKGRKWTLGKVKLAHEQIRETLEIPSGGHRFEVHVVSPGNDLDGRKSIEGMFDPEQRRTLDISVERITNRMDLEWK